MYENMQCWIYTCFLATCFFFTIHAKKHELILQDDARSAIQISQFGYMAGGYLHLKVEVTLPKPSNTRTLGFTLDRASKIAWDPLYTDSKSNECILKEKQQYDRRSIIFMVVNLTTNALEVSRTNSSDISGVSILYALPALTNVTKQDNETAAVRADTIRQLRESFLRGLNNLSLGLSTEKVVEVATKLTDLVSQSEKLLSVATLQLQNVSGLRTLRQTVIREMRLLNLSLPTLPGMESDKALEMMQKSPDNLPQLQQLSVPLHHIPSATVTFEVQFEFPTVAEEDLYSLYFHNCDKINNMKLRVNIVEANTSGFLAAGEQPLPLLMFMLCGVYIVMGFVWFFYLKTSKHAVFKTHYLMLVLVFMKAFSLIFHGINYYVLGKYGQRDETWKVLYYITHLLKGGLMFITVILVGAGWTFVRRILSEREKKLFMVVIPLQILANVATIIIDESEEGTVRSTTWKEIFILVDLLCCGTILFPIIWSIRSLQAAAETDGKAAFNLLKMKLFRQFYVMIICYIYFSRIVVYLLNITVSFRYSWLVELFGQSVTMSFFVITGYMFRPVTENPYFQLAQDDEEAHAREQMEMENVWSQAASREGVSRVNLNNQAFVAEDSGEEETDVMYVAEPKRTASGFGENNVSVQQVP